MSDTHSTTPDHGSTADAHGAADAHGTSDAHGDGHGHNADTLGPIDVRMWAVGLVGVVVALIVVAGFVSATGFAFGA